MNQNSQQEQDRLTLEGWEITKKPNSVDVKFVDFLLAAQGRLSYQRGHEEAIGVVLASMETHRYKTTQELISLIQAIFLTKQP